MLLEPEVFLARDDDTDDDDDEWRLLLDLQPVLAADEARVLDLDLDLDLDLAFDLDPDLDPDRRRVFDPDVTRPQDDVVQQRFDDVEADCDVDDDEWRRLRAPAEAVDDDDDLFAITITCTAPCRRFSILCLFRHSLSPPQVRDRETEYRLSSAYTKMGIMGALTPPSIGRSIYCKTYTSEHSKWLPPVALWQFYGAPNSFSAGASPRTPLEELTRPPIAGLTGV